MNKISKIEWYQKLLEDLRKLEFTGVVLTKWNIGKRIKEDEDKFEKSEYGSKRIENIAKDLQCSSGDVWGCVRLYAKYSDGVRELRGKSWHYIFHNLLYTERPHTQLTSPIPMLPNGKYNIIYADPPWKYWEGGYKNQSQHYPTMELEDIKALQVPKADNCILFLWATFPYLKEALEVIEAWGFTYSTVGFVWIKQNKSGKGFFFGLGNWTRANAEVCLIATRGTIERKRADISQIISEPIKEHSKKPDIVRNKIVALVGDLPRIELFARQKTEGWDTWGLEI